MRNQDLQSFDETIIYGYLGGTATEEQIASLYEWLEKSEQNQRDFAEMKAVWHRTHNSEQSHSHLNFTRSLNRLNSSINSYDASVKLRSRRGALIRFSAAAAIIVVAALMFFTYRQITIPNELCYTNTDTTTMHIVMADGTDIWLGAQSKLSYTENFDNEHRQVKLDGEAFFDVHHDAAHPFLVQTPLFNVKVMGTMFGVHAFEGENIGETILAEGVVYMQNLEGVNMIRLKPGQQAVYAANEDELTVNDVSTEGNPMLLKYGLVTISNATLVDIVSKIEAIYGVRLKISTTKSLQNHYDFNFLRTSTLPEVLEVLQFVADCRLEVTGHRK